MGRLVQVTLGGLAAASANNIALSQTPGGAGNLTLNGALVTAGVATLDTARRVLLTTHADETGLTFTFYGTDRYGRLITESVVGVNNSTVYTKQDFKTITQISVSGATAGAITVGTNGVVSSPWVLLNRNAQPVNVGIAVEVTGTVNYTVQTTYDEIMGQYDPGPMPVWENPGIPVTFDDPVGGSTSSDEFQLLTPVIAVRVTMNSGGTGSSKVVMDVIQAGIRG